MRRIFTILVVLLIFLAACATSIRTEVDRLDSVQLFLAMNDDVSFTEKQFVGEDAAAIADLVQSECPQGVENDFVRAIYAGAGSSLILYTSTDGKEVLCAIFRPADQPSILYESQENAPEEGVALTVNGVQIPIATVERQLAALPAETPRDENTLSIVINRMVNDELLRQAAEDVVVNADEIVAARQLFIEQSDLTENQLIASLEQQGVSVEVFEQGITQQAKLSKLLSTRLLTGDINVTDETLRTYYINNPNQFLQSEQAIMRDIFVSGADRTEEQLLERARTVLQLLNTTDFCELVTAYSDSPDQTEQCGVFVIPRGVIDANLEHASFTTPPNTTSVVTTADGVHFIQTLQTVPPQIVPYEQVADGLRSTLVNSVFQQRLNLYVTTLRSQAEIAVYLA